ncbi:MAG: DUF1549 domain-containing protein [Bryobacteraceae bacterium]
MRHFFALAVVSTAVAADFATEIKPLLEKRCLGCHGAKLAMHGLRLDSRDAALKGGDSGAPSIVPGRAAESILIRYVSGRDKEIVMPPKGPRLSETEVALLSRWIDEGAPFGAQSAPVAETKPRSEHWSFQPVAKITPPKPKNAAWVRNPIDAFVLAKLEEKGWQPAAAAQPVQLLRRIHLDLTGLPPTLAEQDVFSRNPDVEALVNRLLERPTYGERWGRHWLDLVRYAESNGYERDGAKPEAWRYRDYVIGAFNKDTPFDRFIAEQLAGDEVDNPTAETLVALGYNRLGPWDDEPADFAEDRFDQLDDIVSTTSQVFLGLTLGCARCHNHKFDPLTAQDYYSMVAVFNGLKRPQKGRTELTLPVGASPVLAEVAAAEKSIAEEAVLAAAEFRLTGAVSDLPRRRGLAQRANQSRPPRIFPARTFARCSEDASADSRQGLSARTRSASRRACRARARAARISPVKRAHFSPPSHPRALARLARQSAHRARDRESRVAVPLR